MKKTLLVIQLILGLLFFVLLFILAEAARGETIAVTTEKGIEIKEARTVVVLPPLPKGVNVPDSMLVALYKGTENSYIYEKAVLGVKLLSLFPPLVEYKVERIEISLNNNAWETAAEVVEKTPKKTLVPIYALLVCAVSIFLVSIISGARGIKAKRLLFFYLTIFIVMIGSMVAYKISSETFKVIMTIVSVGISLIGGEITTHEKGYADDFSLGGILSVLSGMCIFLVAFGSQTRALMELSGFLLVVLAISFGVAFFFRKIHFRKTAAL